LDNKPEIHKKAVYKDTRRGQWQLTIEEKKRILIAHIFGVDIDPQAVEVSKLSLLLKVLEGETDQSFGEQMKIFQERALPNLADNIRCGNSLIGPDYFTGKLIPDPEELKRVNAFDWNRKFPEAMKAGGFDCVIGNPPYDVLEKERGDASWPHLILAEYVRKNIDYIHGLGGKLNLFRFFVVRSKSLVRPEGRFGMIIPLSILGDISCATTRRFFFETYDDIEADCFPQKDNRNRRIFLDAKLSTVILTASRRAQHQIKNRIIIRTYPSNSFKDKHKLTSLNLTDLKILDPINVPVPLVDQSAWNLCKRLHSMPAVRRLGDIPDFEITRGEINQTIYREFITGRSKHSRLLKGVEIKRYGLNVQLHQGHQEWFDEKRFLEKNEARPVVRQKRIATQRITGVDDSWRIVATILEPPCYFADSTNSIILTKNAQLSLEYLLGILNSKLIQWRFRLTSTNNNVGTNEIKCLPIIVVSSSDQSRMSAHDRLKKAVCSMSSLHEVLILAKSEAERAAVQCQIDSTDKEIDRLVYELYGVSNDEIKIVEGETK